MNRISALTQALQAQQDSASPHTQAVRQLQRTSVPSVFSQPIKEITETHRSKPAALNDGKDWARQVMHEQHKFHPIAVKWAREVLKGSEL